MLIIFYKVNTSVPMNIKQTFPKYLFNKLLHLTVALSLAGSIIYKHNIEYKKEIYIFVS